MNMLCVRCDEDTARRPVHIGDEVVSVITTDGPGVMCRECFALVTVILDSTPDGIPLVYAWEPLEDS